MIIEVLAPLVGNGRAVCTHAWCYHHRKTCCLKVAKRHKAGTSCRPYSRKGLGMRNADVESLYLMSWVGLRLALQEACIVQENVQDFDVRLLSRFLSHLYHISCLLADPTEYGWPVGRTRQFVMMHHKTKILAELSPVTEWSKRFYRACKVTWKELFCFHREDLREHTVIEQEAMKELCWAQSRQKSRAHGKEMVTQESTEPFLEVLNDTEKM